MVTIRKPGDAGFTPAQPVTRSEAVIERALWSSKALRDGIDRDCARTPFVSQRPGRAKKARIVEHCSTH